MVFATTTARDAALTTPSEGMMVWLEDSNKYVYYTGSAWSDLIVAATPTGTGNAIINGAFDIFQRGTSVTAGISTYVSDRWATVANHSGGTVVYTKQTFTPGSSPVSGVPNYLRMTATSPTGASYNTLYQRIEDVNTFAGQTVTLSFYAKADATRSVTISPFQDFGSGGSSQVGITTSSVSLTTTMTRFTYTFAVPSITGKTVGTSSYLGFELQLPLNVTSTIEITGVQLESGSTATAFNRNASNIQGELAACQRYYYRLTANATAVYSTFGWGSAGNSTGTNIVVKPPVSMRVTPAAVEYSTLGLTDGASVTAVTVVTIGANINNPDVFSINPQTSGGLTTFRPYNLVSNNSANGYLGFSAEL
jgi:hypothetical protein